MNALYRLLAAFANTVVAAYRWMVAIEEGPGYVAPAVTHRIPSAEAQAAAWAFPQAKLPSKAYASVPWPTVSLVKEWKTPNLVRPFVNLQAVTREIAAPVVRAVAVARDELGLPKAPMATPEAPTVGIFEQTFAAFVRRTGIDNGQLALAP